MTCWHSAASSILEGVLGFVDSGSMTWTNSLSGGACASGEPLSFEAGEAEGTIRQLTNARYFRSSSTAKGEQVSPQAQIRSP